MSTSFHSAHFKPVPLSPKKEFKLLEHFINERIEAGSLPEFIHLIRQELGAKISHPIFCCLKNKMHYLNKIDPAMRKICLSEQSSENKDFVHFLFSDASPRELNQMLLPLSMNLWTIQLSDKEPKTLTKKTVKKVEKKKALAKPKKKAAKVPKKASVKPSTKKKPTVKAPAKKKELKKVAPKKATAKKETKKK